jgi:hypothetical protein
MTPEDIEVGDLGRLQRDLAEVGRRTVLVSVDGTPEIATLSMSGSSLLVAVNALLLKRLPLPTPSDLALPTRLRADPAMAKAGE